MRSPVADGSLGQLCAKMIFAATPPYDGTLARYYKLPEDLVYHLPDNLSFEEGAMVRKNLPSFPAILTLP
jgi:D-xylulose reductase